MVCYAVPAAAAIVHYIMRRNMKGWKENIHQLWLSLILIGGSIFGVVDHLWNGEIFLIGDNLVLDLMLGATITILMILIWKALVIMDGKTSFDLSK